MALFKAVFIKIVDKLARDVSSEVRLAVFEGMRFMIPCPEAVNAVENAVKRIILWGVNDNVVKIRIAAFQLLGGFKNHRYIKVRVLFENTLFLRVVVVGSLKLFGCYLLLPLHRSMDVLMQ